MARVLLSLLDLGNPKKLQETGFLSTISASSPRFKERNPVSEPHANYTVVCDQTREVEKTRQKYRTEPVYDTWYVWKQGEWVKATTLSAFSNTFELRYPNTSKFENKPNFRVGRPSKDCRVVVEPKIKKLENQEMKINCNLYETLSAGDSGTVVYRKWGGIKNVQL
jgi:hypothetical protein